MATKTISATVNEELAAKLDSLAKETHRKKSYFVNQALLEYFEAIEDYELALSRRGGETVSFKVAKKELGI
jgi:predicted DNA-binding protein